MDVVCVYSPLGQMKPRTRVNMIKHASQFFTYKLDQGHISIEHTVFTNL